MKLKNNALIQRRVCTEFYKDFICQILSQEKAYFATNQTCNEASWIIKIIKSLLYQDMFLMVIHTFCSINDHSQLQICTTNKYFHLLKILLQSCSFTVNYFTQCLRHYKTLQCIVISQERISHICGNQQEAALKKNQPDYPWKQLKHWYHCSSQ